MAANYRKSDLGNLFKLVDEYNNTYLCSFKVKTYRYWLFFFDWRITKYKNIFSKSYTKNSTK